MPSAGEYWERWAADLESIRSSNEVRWPQADLRGAPLAYLFVDGLHSASNAHWINLLTTSNKRPVADRLRAGAAPGLVRAFSYAPPIDRHPTVYGPDHTRVPLPILARQLAGSLPNRRGRRVVPIGFSLGGAVVLLGLSRWIAENKAASPPVSRLMDFVPSVILVAPASTPSPDLLKSYERRYENGGASAEPIPELVYELCEPDSESRTALAAAFGTIIDTGIPIHVVHSPADSLTPYECPDRSLLGRGRLQEYTLAAPPSPRDLAAAVGDHGAVRDDAQTAGIIIGILNAL